VEPTRRYQSFKRTPLADTSISNSGAVYFFSGKHGGYIKATNTAEGAYFGAAIAVGDDAIAVGAYRESARATGINGDGNNTSALWAGAAYVYR
jgi:hypothetical protein